MLNLTPALPEIFLLTMACVVLLADVYKPVGQTLITWWLTQFTLLATLVIVLMVQTDEPTILLNGVYVTDAVSVIMKVAILAISMVAFVYSLEYQRARQQIKGEYYVLGLFAILGMLIMVSAHHFLVLYLGLELMSLSLYAMIAMHRESSDASEAAMKYFVLGAIASGMLLYGMSMIYGITGNLELNAITAAIQAQEGGNALLIFGVVFLVVGIGFKLGAVPFHMWVPDVYQGAPTPVTLFIGSAPKIAALALTLRILSDGLQELVSDWQQMLLILSILSIALGNVIAISQTNIKRMLAYSAISHMGYMLLGIVSGTDAGYAASLFYVIVYTIMTIGGFGMVVLLGRNGFESDRLDDFKGLAKRSPWFAVVMMILMFSMAGVPPFAGFWSKWFVLKEVIDAGYTSLAMAAVLFSVIGAFYYLRIIKMMYFDEDETGYAITSAPSTRMVMTANSAVVVFLGLLPGSLMAVCVAAFS